MKTLRTILLPFLLVGAVVLAENLTETTLETSTTLQGATVVFTANGCLFQSTGFAVRDSGVLGPKPVFGASPQILVPTANATCVTLTTVGLKCLKNGLGLDGGGCP